MKNPNPMNFDRINVIVRGGLITLISMLVLICFNSRCSAPVNGIEAMTGTGRKPLVIINGQNQQIPSGDYLTSPGGISTNSRPSAGPGDIQTSSLNGVVYATVLTDVGIQAAIDAAPVGGTVELLAGATYVLNAGLPITVTKDLTIDCHGWGTILQVAAGVGAATDVVLLKPAPASTVQGITLKDCYITPASGTPARNGFTIDGTNGAIGYMHMDHVRVDQLGGFAVAVRNASGLVTGSPYNTVINNASYLTGGADLTDAGDTVEISGGTILTGTGSLIINTKNAPVVNDFGAHAFLLDHVTSTVSGGIIVQQATQGAIRNCNFEAVVASTEANNCLLDLQGLTTEGVNGLNGFVIEDNYVGANLLYVGCGIRVDKATQTIIQNNYVAQGSVNSYTITANADRTRLNFNVQAPDNAVASYLSDSGTHTSMAYWQPTTHQLSNYGDPINFTQVAIGTTLATGGILDVKSVDAVGGNEPAAWNTQWSTFGLGDGPNGSAIGMAVNSVTGGFVTFLSPSLGYIHGIINALDITFQASHADVASITSAGINLLNAGALHDSTAVVTLACGGAGATATGGQSSGTITPGAGVTTCTITMPKTITRCTVAGQIAFVGHSYAGAVLTITSSVAAQLIDYDCWY